MAKKLTVSVVVTVFNEVGSISDLINSLIHQTLKPAEIIIVDAGSTDGTTKLIKRFKHRSIKTLISKGANRSLARNLGIIKAKNTIIAVTDAGCIPKLDWLEKITKPLISHQADSVAGFYLPVINSLFQRCLAPFVAVMPYQFNPRAFLPSSRSVAFTKKAWLQAGKYPENLNYCEDLVFAAKLKSETHMVVTPQAQVMWELPDNLLTYFHQIRNYAAGDVRARYQPHLIKIISMYARYIVFLFWPQLLGVYLVYILFKHQYLLKSPPAVVYVLLIQFTTDMAVIAGSLQAIINS